MVTDNNQGQDFLAQMYNLQQQYLNSLQQMLQPQRTASPMEQMWQAWSGPQTVNPFMQGPMGAWAQPGQDSLNAFYQQMNSQFGSLMKNPFNLGDWPSLPGLENPVGDLLQHLFNEQERGQAEALMQSLQKYHQVQLEVQQLMSQLALESLEKLQAKLAGDGAKELQQAPQWWAEITQQVFNEAQQSELYQNLKGKLEDLGQQLMNDREQYREALASSLGLVTEQRYQAMQQQLDSLQQQVESLQQAAASSGSEKNSNRDDFTVLNGIGEKLNERLHEHGISTLNQLASMSDEMLKNLDSDLQAKGRVFQDQWREQAEQFLGVMSGKTSKE